MTFSLLQLSKTTLEALAASRTPENLDARAEPDSMPPAFVAARALRLIAAGHPAPWSTSFLIVNDESGKIVGGCGFKNAPANGRVEVGYGVAPSMRGQGAATAALRLLLEMAFDAGQSEVLAEIVPMNHASARVVQKLGFSAAGARVDEEGEHVIQWLKRGEA
jgi:[ribosomal protein S5]-alanine N-acetyltransferase